MAKGSKEKAKSNESHLFRLLSCATCCDRKSGSRYCTEYEVVGMGDGRWPRWVIEQPGDTSYLGESRGKGLDC